MVNKEIAVGFSGQTGGRRNGPDAEIDGAGTDESTLWRRTPIGDERRFWRFCAAAFGGIAVLKGLRFPNAWARTQALLSYEDGFVKRGLLGAVYRSLGIHHSVALAMAFFLELILLFAVLAWFIYTSRLEQRTGSLAIVTMFSSSYVLTFVTHLVGYTDIVSATLALVLLLIRAPRTRFWATLLFLPVAILIHENFLLLFLPIVLFSFVVDGATEPVAALRRNTGVYIVFLSAAAVAMTIYVAAAGSMSPARVDQFHAEVLSHADFTPREEFFLVLKASFRDNILMGSHRLVTARWYGALILAICLLGPLLAGLLLYGRRVLLQASSVATNPWRRYLPWAAMVAILSPQWMHLLGIDAMRWYVMSVFDAFLCLATLSMRLPEGRIAFTESDRRFVVVIVALNLAGGFGLYDHMQITPFPFFPRLLGL